MGSNSINRNNIIISSDSNVNFKNFNKKYRLLFKAMIDEKYLSDQYFLNNTSRTSTYWNS